MMHHPLGVVDWEKPASKSQKAFAPRAPLA
jgi:hypothetical protein